MEQVQTVIIGAGVVGLAIARRLAQAGHEVLILEKENAFGTETSARNSEVIHAGIYYPKGSLKAQFCVAGKEKLYEYCQTHHISHKKCGKLIVATEENQIQKLKQIQEKAYENGVADLEWLTGEQAKHLEPNLKAEAALLSPSTGIIDSHGLMLSLLGEAESHGAMLALETPVETIDVNENKGIKITTGGTEAMTLMATNVINAAGLYAPEITNKTRGLYADFQVKSYFCKGNYFSLKQASPFKHLIYPIPSEAGLGVHITLDLGGRAKFGPDTQWLEIDRPALTDYPVDPGRSKSFYEAIRSYWPDLPDEALEADYSGIRPKIVGPSENAADFRIDGPKDHGIDGLINLLGIESPGLTSCLAIADYVYELLDSSKSAKL